MFSIGKSKTHSPDGDSNSPESKDIDNPPVEGSKNSLRKKSEYDDSVKLKSTDEPDNIVGIIRDGSLRSSSVIVDPSELEDHTTVPFGGLPKDMLEDPEFVASLENHLKTSQDEIENLNEEQAKLKALIKNRKAVTEPVKGYYAEYGETPKPPVAAKSDTPSPTTEVKAPSTPENDHPNKPKTI